MSQNLVSSTPRQAVVFFPYKYHFGPRVADRTMETIEIDATSSILNISLNNSKSSTSGQFSLVLAPDQNWTARIRPGDWLVIYISQFGIGYHDNPKTTKGLRLLGNVDRVTKQRVVDSEGRKRTIYKVMGRDFGKIFEKTQFYFNPYIPDYITTNFVIQQSGFLKITGTPEDFMRSYFNLYFGDGIRSKDGKKTEKMVELDQMRIPQAIYKLFGVESKNAKLADLIHLEIGKGSLKPDGYSLNIPPKQSINGTVWDIFKAISNPLINELFTTMKYLPKQGKVVPTLVLRKIPFSKNTFTYLPTIEISNSTIRDEDLGYSDHERYNYINFNAKSAIVGGVNAYMAISQAKQLNGKPLIPFINESSIKRYGFCSLGDASTEFCHVSDVERKKGSLDPDVKVAEKWQRLLIEWWGNYARTESGTLVLKGFSRDVVVSTSNVLNIDERLAAIAPLKMPSASSVKSSLLGNSIQTLNSLSDNLSKSQQQPIIVPTDTFNVGDNIFLKDRNRLYHLEGYDQEWTAPGEWIVTFSIIRGVAGSPNSGKFQYIDQLKFAKDAFEQQETAVSTTFKTPKRTGK